MTSTANQNTDMEEGVSELYFFKAVENCAECVRQSAGKKPE